MELLTHSKRQSFQTCPRYFYHRHEQRLSLKATKPGRRRGSIFGSLIFTAGYEPEEMQAVADRFYGEIHPDSPEEHWALEVERAKVEVMVEEYLECYGIDDRREIVFDLPLRNPTTGRSSRTFRDAGKIDGCVVTGPQQVRIIEDKFVGSIQRAMIARLPLDAQCSQYVDAFAQKGWTATVAYRHTLYPGINPTKEKVLKTKTHPAETIDQFRERLHADIAERPGHYFDEQILLFPQQHLDDFRRGKWGVGEQIKLARRNPDWQKAYPMNPSRCWEYGGCEFIPLCTRQSGAQDLYQIEADNPELNTGGGVVGEYAEES